MMPLLSFKGEIYFLLAICTYTLQANWMAQVNGISIIAWKNKYDIPWSELKGSINLVFIGNENFRILSNSVVTIFVFLFSCNC